MNDDDDTKSKKTQTDTSKISTEDCANMIVEAILPGLASLEKTEQDYLAEGKVLFQYDTTFWKGYVVWLCLDDIEIYIFSEDWDKDPNNVKPIPKHAMLGMLFSVHPALNMKMIMGEISQLVKQSISVVKWVQNKPLIKLEALWQVHTR